MNRRRLLIATGTLAVASSGCLARGSAPSAGTGPIRDPGGGSLPDGIDGSDSGTPVLADVDLAERPPDTEPGAATVTVDSDILHVDGTLIGETGCHTAELVTAGVEDDGGFHVVIATMDDAEPETLCTQAFSEVGYELEASFDGVLPDTISVAHDDARGYETVVDERVKNGADDA